MPTPRTGTDSHAASRICPHPPPPPPSPHVLLRGKNRERNKIKRKTNKKNKTPKQRAGVTHVSSALLLCTTKKEKGSPFANTNEGASQGCNRVLKVPPPLPPHHGSSPFATRRHGEHTQPYSLNRPVIHTPRNGHVVTAAVRAVGKLRESKWPRQRSVPPRGFPRGIGRRYAAPEGPHSAPHTRAPPVDHPFASHPTQITKKVSQFKKNSRRTAKKLRAAGLTKKSMSPSPPPTQHSTTPPTPRTHPQRRRRTRL